MPGLIVAGDGAVPADSADTGTIKADPLAKGVHDYIHRKGTAMTARTEEPQRANRRKSLTRARGGHPFAFNPKKRS